MTLQINAIRAIGTEFIRRKLKSMLLVVGIFAFIIIIVAVWLTTLSVCWWLLAVPIFIITTLGVFTFIVARAVFIKLSPKLNESQTMAVKGFVDKFERVADSLQTPIFIIVFRIVRDVLRLSREQVFIHTVIEDSTTLRKDYLELQWKFK